jgi:hypothetical protein
MANKKTVVQMYEGILSKYALDAEDKAFIEKRIEITQKKNANRSAEPTPKQKEKMAQDAVLCDKIVGAMIAGATYTPSDLVKRVNDPAIANTQKITPLLTALVGDGVLCKEVVKGRSMYSLSAETADEGEVEE